MGHRIGGCKSQQRTEISVQSRMRNSNALVFALLPASKTTFPGEAGRSEELQASSFHAQTFTLSVGEGRKTEEECLLGCCLKKTGK